MAHEITPIERKGKPWYQEPDALVRRTRREKKSRGKMARAYGLVRKLTDRQVRIALLGVAYGLPISKAILRARTY